METDKRFKFLALLVLMLYSLSAISKQTDLGPLTAALKENPDVNISKLLPSPYFFHQEGHGTRETTKKFLDVAIPLAKDRPDLAFYVASTLRVGEQSESLYYAPFHKRQKLYNKQIELFELALNSTNYKIRKYSAKFLGNIYYYGLLRPEEFFVLNSEDAHQVAINYHQAKKYYSLCGNFGVINCRTQYISTVLKIDANKGIELLKKLIDFREVPEVPEALEDNNPTHWKIIDDRDKVIDDNEDAAFKYQNLWAIYHFGLLGIKRDQTKADEYLSILINSHDSSYPKHLKISIPPKTGKDFYELSESFATKTRLYSDMHSSDSLPTDDKTELFLLEKALSKGNGGAASRLSDKYYFGYGVREDILKSYAYLNLANEFIDGESSFTKRIREIELQKLKKKLTTNQIIFAQQLSNRIMDDLKAKYKEQSNKSKSSSGTGFFVSKEGHIVTNQHVVNQCHSISINQNGLDIPVVLMVGDIKNDVALLKSNKTNSIAYIRGGRGIRQGDSVIAYGYPLSSILSSSAKVTTGMVNSLSGLGDDFRYMQISAPVQPGNSGGPLIDKSGNIVGVVSSKLNAAEIQKTTGDIPQNINFALKSSVIKDLLDANEINYETRAFTKDISTADIVDEASKYTVQIQCLH